MGVILDNLYEALIEFQCFYAFVLDWQYVMIGVGNGLPLHWNHATV